MLYGMLALLTPSTQKRLNCFFQVRKALLSVKLFCDSFTQNVSTLAILGTVCFSVFDPISVPSNFDLHSFMNLGHKQ